MLKFEDKDHCSSGKFCLIDTHYKLNHDHLKTAEDIKKKKLNYSIKMKLLWLVSSWHEAEMLMFAEVTKTTHNLFRECLSLQNVRKKCFNKMISSGPQSSRLCLKMSCFCHNRYQNIFKCMRLMSENLPNPTTTINVNLIADNYLINCWHSDVYILLKASSKKCLQLESWNQIWFCHFILGFG